MNLNKQNFKNLFLLSSIFFGASQVSGQCNAPSPVNASLTSICAGQASNLFATSAGNSINWYTVPVAGVPIGSSPSGVAFTVSPVVTTTYYAESFNAGGTTTLNYTGALQTFTIPAGISTITVDVRGAAGGGNTVVPGGNGGRVVAVIPVTPGQVYNVYVGGAGSYTGTAGYNGGGTGIGGSIGGGGGGATDIRFGGVALANRIIVAGGGGGATDNGGSAIGGAGGGLTGASGAPGGNPWACTNTVVATGGSQAAGGSGGTSISCAWNGFNGSLGQGGNSYNNYRCGGGGGGYYGGGGGHNGQSGAGGSSYAAPTASSVVHTQGFQAGDGQVLITGLLVGCVSASRTAVTVTVNSNPTITVNSGSICSGNSFTIVPSGANTYTIQGGNAVVSPTATTSYSVVGTSSAGCTSQTTAISSVTVNANPTVAVTGPTAGICAGSPFTLTASGAATYSWSNGAATSTIAPTPTANASYTVIGTNTAGCSGNAVQFVNVNPAPSVSVTGAGTICAGNSATLTANGALTYSWSTGSSSANIVVSPTASAVYSVTGTDSLGCKKTVTANIVVSPCTSINQFQVQGSELRIFPNPSGGEFTVELKNGLSKTIDVMDLTGRVVSTNTSDKDKVNININHLANGVYYLRVQSNNTVEVLKVLKQ